MKTTLQIAFVAAGIFLASGVVSAQDASNTYIPPQPARSPAWAQHHASTVEEGVLRGWADVGRAVGEARYNTALAMVHREEALRRRLENYQNAVEDFFQIRRFNKNMRFQTEARPTKEQLSNISKSRLPNRLSGEQFQPTTGALVWPQVLRGESFAGERARIETVMSGRSRDNSGVGSASYQDIRALTARIESKLKSQAPTLSSAETIAARKFLASLNYEVRFPLDAEMVAGLASR